MCPPPPFRISQGVVEFLVILCSEERLARKLQKDRAFLQEIVSVTKEEMLLDRSFEKLKDHIRREDNRRNEEATLLDRMDKASLAVKKLKHRMTEYERQVRHLTPTEHENYLVILAILATGHCLPPDEPS